MDEEITSILFLCRGVKVYKIPPRNKVVGYKAAEWGEDSFLWEGRMRIVQRGDSCTILLEDQDTNELFASSPYTAPGTSVEPVLDSSRYFVLRIVDEQGRKASVGIGFDERSSSFDFNVALQDYLKRSSSSASDSPSSSEPDAPPPPKKDFSLKEGQTFSISIPGAGGARRKAPVKEAAAIGSGGGVPFLLPPPPSGKKR